MLQLEVSSSVEPEQIDTVSQVLPHPCVNSSGLSERLERWVRKYFDRLAVVFKVFSLQVVRCAKGSYQ